MFKITSNKISKHLKIKKTIYFRIYNSEYILYIPEFILDDIFHNTILKE